MIEKLEEYKAPQIDDTIILYDLSDETIAINTLDGLTLINKHFNIIGNYFLVKNCIIDRIFKNPTNKNKLLVCCPENNFLYILDLSCDTIRPIQLSGQLGEGDLTPLYYWTSNTIIVTTFSKKFYVIETEKKTIKNLSPNYVYLYYPSFYKWVEIVFSYDRFFLTFSGDFQALVVVVNEIEKNVFWLDIINKVKKNIGYYDNDFHFATYKNGYTFFVDEKKLTIVYDKHIVDTLVAPISKIFLYARFSENNEKEFIVTTCNLSHRGNSMITLYKHSL